MLGGVIQLLLVFLLTTLFVVYLYLKRNYGYWERRGIPYEKPNILFGNLSFAMRKSIWDFFYDIQKKHKNRDYVGVYLAWKPTLLIHTKELAKQILVKDSDNFLDRYLYASLDKDPMGSLNLFMIRTPLWHQMRAELSPMFTSSRLRGLTDLMNLNAEQLVKRIKTDHVDGDQPVNLKELFSMYTSDTVGYTVFGLRVSVLTDLASPLWNITQHMVQWTFWRGLEFTTIFFVPALGKLFNFQFFSKPATDFIKKIFIDVVEERKKTNTSNDKDLVNHLLKLKARLQLPADAKPELADDLMYAQACVFILGSIETSSTTLINCLHELAYHPDEQEKLYEEIMEARQTKGKNVLDYNDLLELKYLTACIHETLRKHPPKAYLDRQCTSTYKLNDEVTIEPGTPVFVNVMALHYNEEYYPEPEEWRPERFIDSSDSNNNDFTFLPFGEGPRFCIGKRLGMMQIRAALAMMMPKYRFEPAVPYVMESDPYAVLLAPKGGGKVKFILREHQ